MRLRNLHVKPAFEMTPQLHADERGGFLEWFRADRFAELTGHQLGLLQANCSVSRRGVLRGLHAAAVPPGQAKYVTCVRGAVLDAVVDIRVGSPTFGRSELIRLDDEERRAVYVPEGFAHGFLALSDDATVVYLCSQPYAPDREFELNAFDEELAIAWPSGIEPVLSEKDAKAPGLREAQERGLLPRYEDCLAFYESLRSSGIA